MSASSFNPKQVWEEINCGYSHVAYIRNRLDEDSSVSELHRAQVGLGHLRQRIAHIGESLSRTAHDLHLQSNYKSLKFQVNVLNALVVSHLGSLDERQPSEQPVVPPATLLQPTPPLPPSLAPAVQPPLTQAPLVGNVVEGTTNQFQYARDCNIQGGHEACTPIAATTVQLFFTSPPSSPEEINSRLVDEYIHRGMQTFTKLVQGKKEEQEALAAALDKTPENEQLLHDLRSRQIAFSELNLGDFPGLKEAMAMSTSTLQKQEDAVATAQTILQNLYAHHRSHGENGAAVIITLGGKTYVTLLSGKTIYFFDSHGFSRNEDPAYIAHFTRDDAAAVQFLANKLSYRQPQTLLSPDVILGIVSQDIAIEEGRALQQAESHEQARMTEWIERMTHSWKRTPGLFANEKDFLDKVEQERKSGKERLRSKYGISEKVFQEKAREGVRRYQEDQAREIKELNELTMYWLVPTSRLSLAHPRFAAEEESKVAIPREQRGGALHTGAQKAFRIFGRQPSSS